MGVREFKVGKVYKAEPVLSKEQPGTLLGYQARKYIYHDERVKKALVVAINEQIYPTEQEADRVCQIEKQKWLAGLRVQLEPKEDGYQMATFYPDRESEGQAGLVVGPCVGDSVLWRPAQAPTRWRGEWQIGAERAVPLECLQAGYEVCSAEQLQEAEELLT